MTTWQPSPLPDRLDIGIVHLGLGAFFRAHTAAFTEDAIVASGGDWGFAAVSMRDPTLAHVLKAQRGRFALIEQRPDGPQLRQLSVIRRTLALGDGPGRVVSLLASAGVHVVTITVTEKGYGLHPGSRALDTAHPAIAHDLRNPQAPVGLIGTLVAGLALRRGGGHPGLTLMSCDNLPANGKVLRALVLAFARQRDSGLADWIAATCTFPDAMVDRITPAPTAATQDLARQITGQPDPAAVATEPFRQWVIQDRFAGPHPDWAAAGALIVPDVAPFEDMKLRMLNGAHSLLAYIGTLAGFASVRDVMAVPVLARTIAAHMRAAARTLRAPDGFDTDVYARALLDRFANPAIDHRCAQIAMDGSQKMPQRIFAPAEAARRMGQDSTPFALATALWIAHVIGRAEDGTPLPLQDPMADTLRDALRGVASPQDAVAALCALPGLTMGSLSDDPEWRAEVAGMLGDLQQHGVIATLTRQREEQIDADP